MIVAAEDLPDSDGEGGGNGCAAARTFDVGSVHGEHCCRVGRGRATGLFLLVVGVGWRMAMGMHRFATRVKFELHGSDRSNKLKQLKQVKQLKRSEPATENYFHATLDNVYFWPSFRARKLA